MGQNRYGSKLCIRGISTDILQARLFRELFPLPICYVRRYNKYKSVTSIKQISDKYKSDKQINKIKLGRKRL